MAALLAALLMVSAAAVVVGVAILSPAFGWIVGGVLLAAWALVVFRGVEVS